MDTSLSESVQQMVRPGKCVDVYYPDPETAKKQCFRTTVNTRYVQQFATLGAGSSTFTIPPNNGIQDIVLVFKINALTALAAGGLALPRGWGYSLIKQVSFRYGGSSQYFLSGQQLLQNALRKMPNGSSRDDILALGGNAVTGVIPAGPNPQSLQVDQFAYVWLSLPHTTPTAEGKLPPLPSDLLTQQIQVTCELNSLASIFSSATPAPVGQAIPQVLGSAEFQVQQVLFENQGDALARRVDMTTHALSYPIEFTQQEVVIGNLASTTDVQTTTLTGFRSGECKSIHVWLTKDGDTSGPVKNPFNWYLPSDITMTYAGEVYARFDAGSGLLWNLVNGRLSPAANDVLLADAGGGVMTITTPKQDYWVELPFAQTFDPITAHSMYMAGKPITNGIVNLSFRTPSAAADWKLHVSYNYNAVLTFSQGTCDYVL